MNPTRKYFSRKICLQVSIGSSAMHSHGGGGTYNWSPSSVRAEDFHPSPNSIARRDKVKSDIPTFSDIRPDVPGFQPLTVHEDDRFPM